MDYGTHQEPLETREEPKDALELRANIARNRLMKALGALDARRREVLDVGEKVKQKLAVVAVVGAAVAVGGVGYLLYRAVTARSRRPQERAALVRRAWNHPDRFGERESVLHSVAKSVLASLATAAASQLFKRYEEANAPPKLMKS